jgi:hypothetical protein
LHLRAAVAVEAHRAGITAPLPHFLKKSAKKTSSALPASYTSATEALYAIAQKSVTSAASLPSPPQGVLALPLWALISVEKLD